MDSGIINIFDYKFELMRILKKIKDSNAIVVNNIDDLKEILKNGQ